MKVWIIAGLFTVAATPFAAAAAAEDAAECQLDDTRRASAQCADAPVGPATVARPLVVQRDPQAPAPRQSADRRRNGKRIPDAELIGPRGAL